MVDYGAWFGTTIKGFYRYLKKILKKILKKFFKLKKKTAKRENDLLEEVKRRFVHYFNEHHVFPGTLIKGASAYGLSKTGLEEKYGLDMDETKLVLVPAHTMYNALFKNASPQVVFQRFFSWIEGNSLDTYRKEYFIKFSLCVLMEKCLAEKSKEKFYSIVSVLDNIVVDTNNGNSITLKGIIDKLGISLAEMKFYLKENFFPDEYKRYPPEIWTFVRGKGSFFLRI
jgi:hypothetical protein